jgi:hypothetical protein
MMRSSAMARSVRQRPIAELATSMSTCSQLIDAGIDIVTISRRLGHASPDVTLTVLRAPVAQARAQDVGRDQLGIGGLSGA